VQVNSNALQIERRNSFTKGGIRGSVIFREMGLECFDSPILLNIEAKTYNVKTSLLNIP